jgi:hypothetical protein
LTLDAAVWSVWRVAFLKDPSAWKVRAGLGFSGEDPASNSKTISRQLVLTHKYHAE